MNKNKEVIYLLEGKSIDTVNYTGVLKHKLASPKNAKWNTTKVRLSGLLNTLIKENDVKGLQLGDTLLDTQFKSSNLSKLYHENPFTLVEFKPTKKSDVPLNYKLKLVNQIRGTKEELVDLYDQKEVRWNNKKRLFVSKYFKRFERVDSDTMMKDLEYDILEQ